MPRCLKDNVIRSCHDDIGHVGKGKVIENIMRVYWFPGMHNKVKQYVANCLKCIEFSPDNGKAEGYLHPIPKESLPFQTIHVDHLGPLEKTGRGLKHIFLIVDGFTKFIRLYTCKSTTTDEALKHLNDYFRVYSKPKTVISDRGSCFTSHKFVTVMKELSIQHVLVAVATPRANGQAERVNRFIVPMIAKTMSNDNKWSETLQTVEYAVNNTVCRSMNMTPSKLLFGVNQNNCSDKIREMLESLSTGEKDLIALRRQASDVIRTAQNKNSEEYNKKRKELNRYDAGEYVMIRNIENTSGINKKFIPKYKGPYIIKTVLDHDRYVVTDIDGFQMSRVPYVGTVSVDQMRRFDEM